jgi:5-methylcytosine-specific restriction endonuclease McrA
MNPPYTQVALWAGHRCEYCHAPEAVFNLPLEVEHIVPVFRGGEDTAANWALACRACNLYKATYVSGRDPESGEIVGRTPIGRATIARLGINSAAQVAARKQCGYASAFSPR